MKTSKKAVLWLPREKIKFLYHCLSKNSLQKSEVWYAHVEKSLPKFKEESHTTHLNSKNRLQFLSLNFLKTAFHTLIVHSNFRTITACKTFQKEKHTIFWDYFYINSILNSPLSTGGFFSISSGGYAKLSHSVPINVNSNKSRKKFENAPNFNSL